MSQERLGRAIHHSGALVGKVEKAERTGTLEFFRAADAALRTGGVLAALWQRIERESVDDSSGDDLLTTSLRWVDDVAAARELTCRMWHGEVDGRAALAMATWQSDALGGPFDSWRHGVPDVLVGGDGRQVGRAEVDALWSMCASFTDADHRLGGGYARSTLMHYLDSIVRPLLLDATFSEPVGRELMGVAARLCDLCAFMSFDSGEQGLAQRYFVQALRLAHASGDRALGAHVLGDMAIQAHHLGDATRALQLAEEGHRAGLASGSASTAARCAVLAGRAHALRGDAAQAARYRLAAEQRLDAEPAEPEPAWVRFFTTQQLAVECQYIAADLSDHKEVKRIAAVLGPPAAEMQRRRVLSTATLADAYLADNGAEHDVDQACRLLADVVPALPALTSVRARSRVDQVRRRLLRHRDRPAVQEFERTYRLASAGVSPAG